MDDRKKLRTALSGEGAFEEDLSDKPTKNRHSSEEFDRKLCHKIPRIFEPRHEKTCLRDFRTGKTKQHVQFQKLKVWF